MQILFGVFQIFIHFNPPLRILFMRKVIAPPSEGIYRFTIVNKNVYPAIMMNAIFLLNN
jgi:hypothetical protein